MTSAPLRVLVVEDEATIARRLARLTTDILGPRLGHVAIAASIDDARTALREHPPDVLLLDLDVGGSDGFDLIREQRGGGVATIVVSAHTERAMEAFTHGVRDFLPKPFTRERLEQSFQRVLAPPATRGDGANFIGIRRRGATEFIALDDVIYIQGAGTRCELVLRSGERILHDKLLDRLEETLPAHFVRIHKSFLLDARQIARLVTEEGSRYAVILADGTRLPVGRTKVQEVRRRLA
ncbi:MAG TPA: LytTR family DNA-binding domain-containing protein [Thermoanaerobaculia bacterium]|nr:LytTR family DNA-binding domain-containing protein [Thermoanaerobaculia bacterium]